MTHVQSVSQEVGSEDEGLGLFGLGLSSAETCFWRLGEEQEEESESIHEMDLRTWLHKKLENLCAAPGELDHACREAQDFASFFRVSYDIFMFVMEAAKPVFSVCTHDGRWLCLLGSRAIYTLQGRHRRLSAVPHSIRILVELLSLLVTQQKWYHHLQQAH